jgi:glutamate dehydrogenase (NAD(P)+)
MDINDEFGPEKIMTVYNPRVGMQGFVVIDNTALGPGKGGIRMTPSVCVEEVARLARAMTWKNALAGLPFGGAKSGIIANDKHIDEKKKKEIVQAFSRALRCISPSMYIAAPDMNMAEKEVQWYVNANGNPKSATGKPRKLGGLPHELGSTGFGVAQATKVAAKYAKLTLKNATVAIEGLGNVGQFAAQHLSALGAKVVAASDSRGVIYNKNGLDVIELIRVKNEEKTVTNYKDGKILESHKILHVKADILITAAIPDLVKHHDVDNMQFKLIVEGSNIPMTPEIEEKLHEKKVLVIPDFVANAGGVISSYAEHVGKTEKQMFALVKNKITKNTDSVLKAAKKKKCSPREAALELAVLRVRKYCKDCKE